jgi:FkbM family methyltransferase
MRLCIGSFCKVQGMKTSTPKQFARRFASRVFPDRWKKWIKADLFGVPDTEKSLRRMRQLGFDPHSVVDVGAYVGEWTWVCKQVFPAARVLMVEPQISKLPKLRAVASKLTNVEVTTALLGAREKESVQFYENETASSVLKEVDKPEGRGSSLPMTTLDVIVTAVGFDKPDFIKIDVQGYELEVLKGGQQALHSAEAVLMEVNLLEIHDGVPLFHEAMRFMADSGFRLYDICTFFRRPYDGALWQVDAIFVRSSSRLVASRRWA